MLESIIKVGCLIFNQIIHDFFVYDWFDVLNKFKKTFISQDRIFVVDAIPSSMEIVSKFHLTYQRWYELNELFIIIKAFFFNFILIIMFVLILNEVGFKANFINKKRAYVTKYNKSFFDSNLLSWSVVKVIISWIYMLYFTGSEERIEALRPKTYRTHILSEDDLEEIEEEKKIRYYFFLFNDPKQSIKLTRLQTWYIEAKYLRLRNRKENSIFYFPVTWWRGKAWWRWGRFYIYRQRYTIRSRKKIRKMWLMKYPKQYPFIGRWTKRRSRWKIKRSFGSVFYSFFVMKAHLDIRKWSLGKKKISFVIRKRMKKIYSDDEEFPNTL